MADMQIMTIIAVLLGVAVIVLSVIVYFRNENAVDMTSKDMDGLIQKYAYMDSTKLIAYIAAGLGVMMIIIMWLYDI